MATFGIPDKEPITPPLSDSDSQSESKMDKKRKASTEIEKLAHTPKKARKEEKKIPPGAPRKKQATKKRVKNDVAEQLTGGYLRRLAAQDDNTVVPLCFTDEEHDSDKEEFDPLKVNVKCPYCGYKCSFSDMVAIVMSNPPNKVDIFCRGCATGHKRDLREKKGPTSDLDIKYMFTLGKFEPYVTV
jgi:hypothetical protein